jgi:hypothetical protein
VPSRALCRPKPVGNVPPAPSVQLLVLRPRILVCNVRPRLVPFRGRPRIGRTADRCVNLARGLRPASLLALHAQQGLTIPTWALRASPSAPLALPASIRVPVDNRPVRHALLELGAAASVPNTPLPASRALPEPTIQTGDPPFRMNAVNARTIYPHRPNLRNWKTASLFAAPDRGLPLDDRHVLLVLLERLIPTASPTRRLHAFRAMLVLFHNFPVSPNALSALRARSATQLARSAPSALRAR